MNLRCHFRFTIYVLFVCSLLTGSNAFASGIRIVSEQYVMDVAINVCVVDVLKVDKKEILQKFNDGSSRHISTLMNMQVKATESLKGECHKSPFTTNYTTPVTATFDGNDEIQMRYTILKLNTGLELDVEVGQRYILSYLSWDEEVNIQQHQRVNSIKDKARLMSLIAD